LIAGMLFPSVSAVAAQGRPERPSPGAELGRIRSMAEAQHEIVMLLIRKKEYSQAAAEAGKIFAMNWPLDQEPVLLKELLFLSDQFVHNGQPKIGLQLLEDNSKAFRTAPSKASIWKEKGYLHKLLKDDDKALECFREARRLESP
jgi:hypothetical protein